MTESYGPKHSVDQRLEDFALEYEKIKLREEDAYGAFDESEGEAAHYSAELLQRMYPQEAERYASIRKQLDFQDPDLAHGEPHLGKSWELAPPSIDETIPDNIIYPDFGSNNE